MLSDEILACYELPEGGSCPYSDKVAALEAQVQRLTEALTNNGKYTWYHFETWANGIENKQRHQSILTEWLFVISRLVKSLEKEDA